MTYVFFILHPFSLIGDWLPIFTITAFQGQFSSRIEIIQRRVSSSRKSLLSNRERWLAAPSKAVRSADDVPDSQLKEARQETYVALE